MNAQQEKWTEEVLESFDGMSRAEPGPYTYEKILNRIRTRQTAIPLKWVWLVSASFVVLMVINIAAAKHVQKETVLQREAATMAAQNRFLNSSDINYQ